jgi:hypothetical protein
LVRGSNPLCPTILLFFITKLTANDHGINSVHQTIYPFEFYFEGYRKEAERHTHDKALGGYSNFEIKDNVTPPEVALKT